MSSNNSFEWNTVTFYWGLKRTLIPPIYFQGVRTKDLYAPVCRVVCGEVGWCRNKTGNVAAGGRLRRGETCCRLMRWLQHCTIRHRTIIEWKSSRTCIQRLRLHACSSHKEAPRPFVQSCNTACVLLTYLLTHSHITYLYIELHCDCVSVTVR